ncbi:MAG: phasin family protein [Pseudomonadota bacterium]
MATKAKDKVTDQFKQFADMQAKSLEPMRQFFGIAADASEKLLRKHYEVMGDLVEHTVAQTRAPLAHENLNDLATAQLEQTKAFFETMNVRTAEYADITKTVGEELQAATAKAASAVKAA